VGFDGFDFSIFFVAKNIIADANKILRVALWRKKEGASSLDG
tara:strand:- start:1006 stop:1131 length:126 start_codon:yes stop_codon:yes gene_type:complete